MSTDQILHADLSESIIGASMKVLNTLRPGLDEKAYENALAIELRMRGHHVDQQRRFDVLYEGHVVDTLIPDLLVDSLVIVDPKVTEDFLHPPLADDRLPRHHPAAPRDPPKFQTRQPTLEAGRPLIPSVPIREIRG